MSFGIQLLQSEWPGVVYFTSLSLSFLRQKMWMKGGLPPRLYAGIRRLPMERHSAWKRLQKVSGFLISHCSQALAEGARKPLQPMDPPTFLLHL